MLELNLRPFCNFVGGNWGDYSVIAAVVKLGMYYAGSMVPRHKMIESSSIFYVAFDSSQVSNAAFSIVRKLQSRL